MWVRSGILLFAVLRRIYDLCIILIAIAFRNDLEFVLNYLASTCKCIIDSTYIALFFACDSKLEEDISFFDNNLYIFVVSEYELLFGATKSYKLLVGHMTILLKFNLRSDSYSRDIY